MHPAFTYAAITGACAALSGVAAAPIASSSSAATKSNAPSAKNGCAFLIHRCCGASVLNRTPHRRDDSDPIAIQVHNYGSIHYLTNPTNVGEALPMTEYGGSRVYFSNTNVNDDNHWAMLSNTQDTPVWMSVNTAKPEGPGPFEVTWQRQSSETSTPIAWALDTGEVEASITTVDGRTLDWWCYRESNKTWLIFDSSIKFPEECQGVNFHVDAEYPRNCIIM